MIHLEDVLKMSWRRFSRRFEDVLKTSWRRLGQASWRCLEDVLKTSWKCLEDVLKASWRRLEDVLKASWRRLEDVWPRQIYWSWPRRLEDVFWRRKAEVNIFVLIKTSWRRLPMTKTKDKTSSSRLMFAGLTLKKEQMLLIVLKKAFLNWWLIVSMVNQWRIYKKKSMSD